MPDTFVRGGTEVSSFVPPAVAMRIVEAGRRMDQLGLVRSVAGNISERLAPDADGAVRLAVTRSGPRKGFLVPGDVIAVDGEGAALRAGDRPSAETLLHARLYRRYPAVGAVVHGHSIAATVLTRATDRDLGFEGDLAFEGFEMLKAFGGGTHAERLVLPVFDNDQDMGRLADAIDRRLDAGARAGAPRDAAPMGFALRGHGLYAWGTDMDDALGRLEAAEFLLECALEERRIRR